MDPQVVAAFIGLAAVIVIIPGPAVVLVSKTALLGGRRPAVATAVGVLTADVIWAAASVAGLTALMVASQLLFDLVRIVGAAYLIFLGAKLLLTRLTTSEPEGMAGTATPSISRAYREGLLCDLTNPKTVLVFASVIPQFLREGSTPAEGLVLGLVFASLGFAVSLGYAVALGGVRGFVRNPRVVRTVLRVGGGLLVLLGVGLLVEDPVK